MTTQPRVAVVMLGTALVGFSFLAGGCGTAFESNQAACRRAINHVLTCGANEDDLPPGFRFLLGQLCETVPETSKCDEWHAYADCVTSFSCVDFFVPGSQEAEECDNIWVGLESSGCSP